MAESAESGQQDQEGQGSRSEILLPGAGETPAGLTPAQGELRRMVLDSVAARTSKLAYGNAIDHLFAIARGRPLTRAVVMEFRASMEGLAPSTANVRMSAVRKLVGEARRNGFLGAEEAATLTDVPNLRQSGTRLGNWLTREQARELLAIPDRDTLKGKRDYAVLAVLVGCGLRRAELAALDVEILQLRENR